MKYFSQIPWLLSVGKIFQKYVFLQEYKSNSWNVGQNSIEFKFSVILLSSNFQNIHFYLHRLNGCVFGLFI